MRKRDLLFLLPLLAGACAAARLDVIQTGPWFPARDWREVEVFSSRERTRAPWGAIAIIHSPRVKAAGSERELARMKVQVRREAAAIGADGVILAVDSPDAGPQLGQYQEPEVFISALAFKYVATASTPIAK